MVTDHDEMPVGRPKIIHPEGLLAKVSYKHREGHDYSGHFNEDSDTVIIRFSDTLWTDP